MDVLARWRDLFNTSFDVLLYDLTSLYFAIDASDIADRDKRRHGSFPTTPSTASF